MKRSLAFTAFVALVLLVGCRSESEAVLEVEQPQASAVGDGSEDSAKPTQPRETLQDASQSGEVVYGDQFPEVLSAKVSGGENGDWRFSVTLSSPYDSPSRYADAWRVLDGQGKQLGIRVLGHDHASEQPFTRSGAVQVPVGTAAVFLEGRDQKNGWSGQRFEFKMP